MADSYHVTLEVSNFEVCFSNRSYVGQLLLAEDKGKPTIDVHGP